MEKKQLNSNVVTAAQLLSGFASVLLISANLAIGLLIAHSLNVVKESKNALLESITQLMELSMHWDAVFVDMELKNLSNQIIIPGPYLDYSIDHLHFLYSL